MSRFVGGVQVRRFTEEEVQKLYRPRCMTCEDAISDKERVVCLDRFSKFEFICKRCIKELASEIDTWKIGGL